MLKHLLGFIIPVKPQKHSTDWNLDNALLRRTLKSVCGQTSRKFKVILVYSDLPEIESSENNLHYVHYPYGDITIHEITDWADRSQWYAPAYAERMMDKSRKIMLGCKLAKEIGCKYLMSVDSDDLVSNQLAYFVDEHKNKQCPGWRMGNGYIYMENSRIILKNKKIWGMNGSTHIIREDLVSIPDLDTNYNLFDYSLFEGHAYTYQRLIYSHSETLSFLPFYGVVYLIHNNYSKVKEILSANVIKLLLKKMIFGKYLNKKIRAEFGLYPLK